MCTVTVVIPYYNREQTIVRALDSVKHQTYKDYEVILINDGSVDKSREIVEKYILENQNMKIHNYNQINSGPSKARNLGIEMAEGEYIAFLDSDDSWHKDKLKIQMKILKSNEEIVILGTDIDIINERKVDYESYIGDKIVYANFYKMLFKNFFITPSVIVKKDTLIENNILFKEYQNHAEDQLFFLQIIRKFKGAKVESKLTYCYKNTFGASGLSGDLLGLEKNELSNFIVLYKENEEESKGINILLLIIIMLFSVLKHIRRTIITKFLR